MAPNRSRESDVSRHLVLFGVLLTTLACARRHETVLVRDAGPGSGPAKPAPPNERRDASIDAETLDGGAPDSGETDAGDAGPPRLPAQGGCTEGTVQGFCVSELDCPRLENALEELSGAPLVVQRPCAAPDGTPLISVGSSYLNHSGAFIYDAASEALVAVYENSDVSEFCEQRSSDVFYGPLLPDCAFRAPENVPDACAEFFGMLQDGGTAPTPDECIFIEE
jgi:hypothetical protein